MSDDESFVILGSSPMSSLETDGMEARKQTIDSSLDSDTPGSGFTSLRRSQLNDLKCAQESTTQTHIDCTAAPPLNTSTSSNESIIKSIQTEETKEKTEENVNCQLWSRAPQETREKTEENTNCQLWSRASQQTKENAEENANSQLWSRAPQVQVEENVKQFSLEDCALKSPLELQQQQKIEQQSTAEEEQTNKTKPSGTVDSSLAASFIMGEINSDILKTSVYSQFPSISLEACPEDVVKLQNMVTEYSQLKSTIKKANNTMKLFYQNSLQWKEKMQTMEEDYKQQLSNCKREILELRQQNDQVDKNFQTQIEALEIARKKDREEYIQEISEKSALLENMRVQIIKLEQQQLASFDMELQPNDMVYVSRLDHEQKIKDLQRQMSQLLASNLDLKDVEKQYVDELNCLKVNLAAAEELIANNRSEIIQLQSLNIEKNQHIQTLETSFESLQTLFEEQKERIALLEAQNEVHRSDFEIEKQSRETAVKEKQQMLQDLRCLQKRNQDLIEEQQKLADIYQRKISTAAANTDAKIIATSAAAAADTYFNNPQRPIRVLPSPTAPSVALHMCPICNKGFKSLNILISHVDECVDKN